MHSLCINNDVKTIVDDDDSSSDTDVEEDDIDRTVDLKHVLQGKPLVDKVSNAKETEAGTEISVLVNYCQSVQFTSFENAESEFYNNFVLFFLSFTLRSYFLYTSYPHLTNV